MRRAANFNPEWGYLAPAPTFMRSARLVLVATAIGASAGAAVVFSLIDRPVAEQSVAARTLVQTPLGSESAKSVRRSWRNCKPNRSTPNRRRTLPAPFDGKRRWFRRRTPERPGWPRENQARRRRRNVPPAGWPWRKLRP